MRRHILMKRQTTINSKRFFF